ncbi:conserved hypothetical protein [Trichinella spiralis]|uniref:hypothetical protein n=1 Tax=Trichinella spiralis TaxID=6334 RepID=UPI0001EFC9CC|nr:conserved hypothetical protein [Trichinella spiralis]
MPTTIDSDNRDAIKLTQTLYADIVLIIPYCYHVNATNKCTKQPPAGKFGLGKKIMIKRAEIFAGAINKQHQCIDQLLSATEKWIAESVKLVVFSALHRLAKSA